MDPRVGQRAKGVLQKYVVFFHEIDLASPVIEKAKKKIDHLTERGYIRMHYSPFLSTEVTHIVTPTYAKKDQAHPATAASSSDSPMDNKKRKHMETESTQVQSVQQSPLWVPYLAQSFSNEPPKPQEDPIELARKRGVRIILLQEFISWLSKQFEKVEKQEEKLASSADGKTQSSAQGDGNIHLSIHDIDGKWRTLRFEFKPEDVTLPLLARMQPYVSKTDPPEILQNPKTAAAPKKSGYCEYCRVAYEGYEEHVSTTAHQEAEKTYADYTNIDEALSQLPMNIRWRQLHLDTH